MIIDSHDARDVIVTITELARFGAIGVALAALILTFLFSVMLLARANATSEGKLAKIIAHAKSTQKLAFLCLVVAVALELFSTFWLPKPVELVINLFPQSLYSDKYILQELAQGRQPIAIKLADKDVSLATGSNRIPVAPNSTLSLDVYNLIDGIRSRDQLLIGQERINQKVAGPSGPTLVGAIP